MSELVDIVIPYMAKSEWGECEELRYALRSIEKNLTGYNQIFIIGEIRLPEWLTNVIHIPANDDINPIFKDRNIHRKLMIACNDERISERFVAWQDDYYLSKKMDARDIPYCYREADMITSILHNKNDIPWITSLQNTRNNLMKGQFNLKMFDSHFPIIYEKSKYKWLEKMDWEIEYGYAIKSLYSNLFRIEGELMRDWRLFPGHLNQTIINYRINQSIVFSTSPEVPDIQRVIIKAMYPKKSKFEK